MSRQSSTGQETECRVGRGTKTHAVSTGRTRMKLSHAKARRRKEGREKDGALLAPSRLCVRPLRRLLPTRGSSFLDPPYELKSCAMVRPIITRVNAAIAQVKTTIVLCCLHVDSFNSTMSFLRRRIISARAPCPEPPLSAISIKSESFVSGVTRLEDIAASFSTYLVFAKRGLDRTCPQRTPQPSDCQDLSGAVFLVGTGGMAGEFG